MNPAIILWLAAAVAGMERDPKLAALMREDPGAEAAVVATLAKPDVSAKRRVHLLGGLCEVAGMRGRYADAAKACEAEAKIDKGSKDSAVFWRSIAAVPPPVATGSAELPVTTDGIGLSEVTGMVNGTAIGWGVDTGAEVSIMPASMAERLGLRRVGGDIRMGTSTVPVNGTLAVIDEVKLGAAAVRNVVVLVLPDARFTVGPGMKMPPLLGLPILQAFGKMAWLDGVKRLALGSAVAGVPRGAGAQLYWHEDGIGLRFDAVGGRFVAHFDSGANRLSLYPDALPLLSAAERSSIRKRDSLTGGAGGVLKRKQDHVGRLAATVAGVPVNFADVPVERDLGNSGARLGMDYVKQLSSLTLDFTSMRALAVPKPTDSAAVDLGFLAGEWVLSDASGKRVGTSRVSVDLPGTVISEVRRDQQGTLPVWFVRTERENGWSQLFPGPKGALREFTPVSAPGEWPLVLGSDTILGDGRAARFRLTMTREGAEGSRRLLEMSVDGGAKWQTIFDYRYARAGR